MKSKETLKKHAELMDQMAISLGIDFEDQVISGKLPFDEISDAVLRCTNCTQPEDCSVWLADEEKNEGKTPGYCQNIALFEELMKRS